MPSDLQTKGEAAPETVSATGASKGKPVETAILVRDIVKSYTLYDSPLSLMLAHTGLDKALFWRPKREFKEFRALNGVTFELGRGERMAIIGRNGAGKTTLLKLLTGNFVPTSGEIKISGTVQALMQTGLGFDPEFSGIQNIRASILYNGLAGDSLEQAVEEVVEFVELEEFLYQPVKTYSKGMLSRLQFAVSTAIKPDILIIDEVLGAGDSYFSGKSAHRMNQLANSGCTLLLVSHSMAQVLQFCDRAIWLDNGEIRDRGESLKIVKEYEKHIEALKQKAHWKEANAQEAIKKSEKSDIEDFQQTLDYATPDWQAETLAKLVEPEKITADGDGVKVSRWAAEKGLKIRRIDVLDEHGNVASSLASCAPASIDIHFYAEHADDFECRFVILIMTLSGLPLIRHLSEPHHLTLAEGEEARVRLSYDKLLLAKGEFVFSAAIYKHYHPDVPQEAKRYDLLSRSFKLKILPTSKSEPGIIAHSATWTLCGKEIEPEPEQDMSKQS